MTPKDQKDRNFGLDPDLANFIRALARESARKDHFRELSGEPDEQQLEKEPGPKNRSRLVVRLLMPDGSYRILSPSKPNEAFAKYVEMLREGIVEGRFDEFVAEMENRKIREPWWHAQQMTSLQEITSGFARPTIQRNAKINIAVRPEITAALDRAAAAQQDAPARPEMVRRIIREWLADHGYLIKDAL